VDKQTAALLGFGGTKHMAQAQSREFEYGGGLEYFAGNPPGAGAP
ncbi:hypothetical protein BMETH_228211371211, partial [methanotrophic bacterial endosymbiont of Bathymodiolus sp.]